MVSQWTMSGHDGDLTSQIASYPSHVDLSCIYSHSWKNSQILLVNLSFCLFVKLQSQLLHFSKTWHIPWQVLKIAFRSLQIWNFLGEDTPRSPYEACAFGTRDNVPLLEKTWLRPDFDQSKMRLDWAKLSLRSHHVRPPSKNYFEPWTNTLQWYYLVVRDCSFF